MKHQIFATLEPKLMLHFPYYFWKH